MKKHQLKTIGEILAGGIAGYSFFWLISHPGSRIKQKLPQKNIKNLQFLPNIKYAGKGKVYHFHHWSLLVSFYLPILLSRRNVLRHKSLHGFVIGSIIQGLLFKDRFKFTYPAL